MAPTPKKPPANPKERAAAVRWFRKRVAVTQAEYDALGEAAKRQAFTIGRVQQLNVVQAALEEMTRAVKAGQSIEEFRARLRDKLAQDFATVESARLQRAFHTSTQRAYNAGRWEQLHTEEGVAKQPFFIYDAVRDARTTLLCWNLHGTVVPSVNTAVRRVWPPLHWFCRMSVRGISRSTAYRHGITHKITLSEPITPGFGLAPPLQEDWEPDASDYDRAAFAIYEARAKRKRGGKDVAEDLIKLSAQTHALPEHAQPEPRKHSR